MLVMIAWLSLARRPPPLAVLIGAGLVVVLIVVARNRDSVRHSVWVSVLLGTPAVLVALLALHRWRDARWVRAGAALLLTATVFFGSSYAVYVAETIRNHTSFFNPLPSMATPQARSAYDALQPARNWPDSRVESGPHRFANNDGALLNVEGARYYSSYLPAETAQALQGLGVSWSMSGRHIQSPTDPVTRALMGVTTYLDSGPKPTGYTVTTAGPAAPLVTVHPADVAQPGTSAFTRQEALLGDTVYQMPELHYASGPTATRTPDGWQLVHTPAPNQRTVFTVSCAPGSEAYFYAPWFNGWVRGPVDNVRFTGRATQDSNGMRELGTVPAGSKFKVSVDSFREQVLPDRVIGCLNTAKLAAAVAHLRATGATRVRAGGHTIDATLPAGSTGMAVVAVPAVKGWLCSHDGGSLGGPTSVQGFIGVPLGNEASSIHCTFKTPGLRSGVAVSGFAIVVLLATAGTTIVRSRRRSGR
jgi:hypothetical protein